MLPKCRAQSLFSGVSIVILIFCLSGLLGVSGVTIKHRRWSNITVSYGGFKAYTISQAAAEAFPAWPAGGTRLGVYAYRTAKLRGSREQRLSTVEKYALTTADRYELTDMNWDLFQSFECQPGSQS